MTFSAHIHPGPDTFGSEIRQTGMSLGLDEADIDRALDYARALIERGWTARAAIQRADRVLRAQAEIPMPHDQAVRLVADQPQPQE